MVFEAERKGMILLNELKKIKEKFPNRVERVLGKGLIAAIHFKNNSSGKPDSEFTSKLAEKCMQKGLLLVHTGREAIKIGPPLTIKDEALLEGISVIHESISELITND